MRALGAQPRRAAAHRLALSQRAGWGGRVVGTGLVEDVFGLLARVGLILLRSGEDDLGRRICPRCRGQRVLTAERGEPITTKSCTTIRSRGTV